VSYKEFQQHGIVMQQRDYSCGAATLATIARYYWGEPVDENYFLKFLPDLLPEDQVRERIKNGLALTDLRDLAKKGNYDASMRRIEFEVLRTTKAPVIVGITTNGQDHFVVFRGADEIYAYLADPIRGQIRVPIVDFIQQWQKNAILVIAKRDCDVPAVNPMRVLASESYRGELNDQMGGGVPLQPKIPQRIPLLP
jgi:hypothetical protein